MSSATYPEFHREPLPRWALVRQELEDLALPDAATATREALQPVMSTVRPGMRVCVAAGSRGIDRIDQVVGAVVRGIREAGATVFIVPAMGSHGGATPEGQLAVLAGYGITPDAMGCEIRASMDTVDLGEVVPGVPVYLDRHAFEDADLIVPVNRVKPHTGFAGPIESGLMKMIAIGLGKQRGADTFHRLGYDRFSVLVPAVARHTIATAPIAFGVALVEDGLGHLAHVEAIPAGRIEAREAELLAEARTHMARLPLDRIDVLVLDLIGKDISGTGMDPNVIGRAKAGSSRYRSPHRADHRARPDTGHQGQRERDRVRRRGAPTGRRRDGRAHDVPQQRHGQGRRKREAAVDRGHRPGRAGDRPGVERASCLRRGAHRPCAQHEGSLGAARQRVRA